MLPGWSLSFGDELAAAIRRQLLADSKFAQAFGPDGIQRWAYYEETGKNRTRRPGYVIVVQGWRVTAFLSQQEKGEVDILEVFEFEERDRPLLESEGGSGAIFEYRDEVIRRAGGLLDINGVLLPNYLTKRAGWTPPVQPGLAEGKKFYAAGIVNTYHYERDLTPIQRG